jgi:hypothetical protein
MSSQLHLQDGCPKPATRQKLSSYPHQATTIEALGDDLLLEIFHRLPSLETLTRAALTCRAWRLAVASCSPAFRRRFRELHRSPLLGVFGELIRVALPVFAAARSRDPDVVAAIRRVDFALSFLSEPHADAGGVLLRWRLCYCRDGRLLLVDWDAELLAIVNPLSRRRPDYIHMPLTETTTEGRRGGPLIFADVHLLSSTDDDLNSFRLVHFCCDESGVRASVFSSDTRDWSVHPWTEVAARAQHPDGHQYWLVNGMQADGFISWPFCNREYVLMLDTTTMEFSVLELPPICRMTGMNFVVTRRDGAPCVVYYYYGSIVGVKVHRVHDEDGLGRWSLGAAQNC